MQGLGLLPTKCHGQALERITSVLEARFVDISTFFLPHLHHLLASAACLLTSLVSLSRFIYTSYFAEFLLEMLGIGYVALLLNS